jgi:hypothetical protein
MALGPHLASFPGGEADCLPQSSVEVKNSGAAMSLHHVALSTGSTSRFTGFSDFNSGLKVYHSGIRGFKSSGTLRLVAIF